MIRYRYRGTDPDHPDNRRLRLALERGTPLIYFIGIAPGKYLAVGPVYIVGDDPANLCVLAVTDTSKQLDLLDRGGRTVGDNLNDSVREVRNH